MKGGVHVSTGNLKPCTFLTTIYQQSPLVFLQELSQHLWIRAVMTPCDDNEVVDEDINEAWNMKIALQYFLQHSREKHFAFITKCMEYFD